MKYYKLSILLPTYPIPEEYVIKLEEEMSKEETNRYLCDIIQQKHEDTVDTAEIEEESGVEYEYSGSYTEIQEEEYNKLVEQGIEKYFED